LPLQLQKHQAFPEMPRQLRKFEFNFTAVGNKHNRKTIFKLYYANTT